MIFIDLRDREGIVQTQVFSEAIDRDALTVANSVRSEYVVEVQGVVKKRKPQAVNPEMKTGDIEVEVHDITILNKAKTPPFYIEDNVAVTEETKLKYRYLDLRRPEMQKNIFTRAHIMRSVHHYLDDNGFIDVETPTLTQASTPRRGPGLSGAIACVPRQFLRLAAIPTAVQAIIDGSRI